jgi:hypothetical protein
VTPVVLTIRPIRQGWAVYLGDDQVLAQFLGADAEQSATDYVTQVNRAIAGY